MIPMKRIDAGLAAVSRIGRAGTVQSAAALFEEAIEPFGCKTYSTWMLANPKRFHPRLGLISNWPEEWTDIYIRTEGFLVDPVVRTALTFPGGFHWREIVDSGSAAAHELFRNAAQFGLDDGFSLPVGGGGRRPAIVNLSGGGSFEWDDLEQGVVSFLSDAFLARILHLRDLSIRPAVQQLAPQELRVLYHAAVGRSDKEIALEMELSPFTVQSYWRSVRRKLGAQDRAHAVAVGIWSGQIAP
jgi:DNA-binding CsgD family transcriptional regulator